MSFWTKVYVSYIFAARSTFGRPRYLTKACRQTSSNNQVLNCFGDSRPNRQIYSFSQLKPVDENSTSHVQVTVATKKQCYSHFNVNHIVAEIICLR